METILDHVEDLAGFVAVAEEGSFSRAASRLGVTKSTMSKRIARLEARLGTPLLRRTTRAQHLTDAGQRLLVRAQDILESIREAEAEVHEQQAELRGVIRVNAPVSLGLGYVSPLLIRLAQQHPGLEVALDLADRQVDLVSEGYDVAVRVGALIDSSLVAKKILDVPFRVVVAPSYLARYGRPKSPKELGAHACLLYRYQVSGARWDFAHRGGVLKVPVAGPLLSNHGDVLAQAAVMGLGIALLPSFIVAPLLETGSLVALFPRTCRIQAPIHLLYPPGRRMNKKVQVFSDALVAHFQAQLKNP